MAERADPRYPGYRGTVWEEELRSRYGRCSAYVRNRRVLDVPCGTGWGTSLLPGAASLTAVDIDRGATAFGKSQYPGIHFAVGTMAALPFREGAFEVVICLEGLEHVYRSEARAFIAEARRTLAPGGVFIATVPLLNGGKHSGNQYHLFEDTKLSVLRLLNSCFETSEQEVFINSGGPEVWFVGKPRATALPEDLGDDSEADAVTARAVRWLNTVRIEDGYCYAPGQPKTLASTCLAVLLLESTGALEAVEQTDRSAWSRYIQSCQAADTGIFHDPVVDLTASTSHDVEYLEWHTTYLAIQALDALGASASAPLRFVDAFAPPHAVEKWLDGLEWQNPWMQSNRIMALLAAIVYRVECEHQTDQSSIYHAILDWLDRKQNPHTGLWGTGESLSLLNAVAGAYHFLPFYEYVHRPIAGIHQIIDSTLELQQADGLFAAEPGGGACEDLDAVDVLTVALRHTSYRKDEVKRALVRAYWATWNLQNDDGSFPYARSNTKKTYSFGGCAALTASLDSGDIWSTWFRPLLLATVAAQFPGDVPACRWVFRRWPALGYHQYGHELSAAESAILPVWIRKPVTQPAPERSALVTVVVTCYNLGAYLHEAITSILQQTLQPVAVILVDDGSTDPFTAFLLDRMPWEGVQLIRQRNEGVAAARNRGIRMASTPYICCLDADDRLHPEYLAKAVEALERDRELGFVSCYYRLFDCDEGTYRYVECRLPNMLVRNEAVGVSVFRKDAWQMAGGYCEALSGMHDWDLWIGILEAGHRAAVIPEVLFEYRRRPQSMYSVTSRPENYQRLTGMIVSRHAAMYQQYSSDTIPLYARQFSEFIQFDREQTANRDRNAACLRSELRREQHISNERHAWIETLEEAKRWLSGQLAAAEQARQGQLPEPGAAERQPAALRSLRTGRVAESTSRWMRRLRGAAYGAGLLLSAKGFGQRWRNLLFWAKAYSNGDTRRILMQHYQPAYYLARYPDIAKSGVPGLLHYICIGGMEGRNPSDSFDFQYYLNRYPDVAESGIHPLLHYVLFGAREGRFAKPPDGSPNHMLKADAPWRN
jgi:glycosyltransferase involved in cell wall biosynthesis/SAM-dependent methyltransferase